MTEKIEQLYKTIDAKPQLLKFTRSQTDSAIENGNFTAMERLRNKLPKLVITKFKDTHTVWLRFWNQFKAEIDSFDISPIRKFSYLKELVDPKVRSMIDALPFNSEGYFTSEEYFNNQVWEGKRNHQRKCQYHNVASSDPGR